MAFSLVCVCVEGGGGGGEGVEGVAYTVQSSFVCCITVRCQR